MYENWKILKSEIEEKADEYSQVADWCNENGYTIVEDGKYYKTVKLPEPTPPSEDELKAKVRAVRDSYLLATDYTQLPDAPFTPEQKAQYAEYREYLRNYTETEEWWLNNPMDFNSWRKNNDISW